METDPQKYGQLIFYKGANEIKGWSFFNKWTVAYLNANKINLDLSLIPNGLYT